MEEFKKLLPQITQMKQLESSGAVVCWEAYEASGRLIGYAFSQDIPETVPDIPGADEMDRYRVFGLIDPVDYKIINLDIILHPEMAKDPWTLEVTEPGFEHRFIGLTAAEIGLSPDGKIDAVSEATLSSTWITDAIREKVKEIVQKTKAKT